MLGFARNIVFFSGSCFRCGEKFAPARARATFSGVAALASIPFRFPRAVELKVPGDFFFVDAVLLCFACVEMLCSLELVHPSDVLHSSVLQSDLQWNGCVKFPRCCSCMRHTFVRCS